MHRVPQVDRARRVRAADVAQVLRLSAEVVRGQLRRALRLQRAGQQRQRRASDEEEVRGDGHREQRGVDRLGEQREQRREHYGDVTTPPPTTGPVYNLLSRALLPPGESRPRGFVVKEGVKQKRAYTISIYQTTHEHVHTARRYSHTTHHKHTRSSP